MNYSKKAIGLRFEPALEHFIPFRKDNITFSKRYIIIFYKKLNYFYIFVSYKVSKNMNYINPLRQILLVNYYIPSLKTLIASNKIKNFYKRYSNKYIIIDDTYYYYFNNLVICNYNCVRVIGGLGGMKLLF
jgi:hypothetical protein